MQTKANSSPSGGAGCYRSVFSANVKEFSWKINNKINLPSEVEGKVASAFFQLKIGHGCNNFYLTGEGKENRTGVYVGSEKHLSTF